MGHCKLPEDVKLICGLLFNTAADGPQLFHRLQQEFGPIDYYSETLPFDFTSYYAPEMGDPLQRQFVSFQKLIRPDELADIKIGTNAIENELARDEKAELKRNINIDPGYMNPSTFILASTKNYSHRIYLRDGIYAEIELIYEKKMFHPVPWTYPDYQSEAYHAILKDIRSIYFQQRREISNV